MLVGLRRASLGHGLTHFTEWSRRHHCGPVEPPCTWRSLRVLERGQGAGAGNFADEAPRDKVC